MFPLPICSSFTVIPLGRVFQLSSPFELCSGPVENFALASWRFNHRSRHSWWEGL